MAVSKLKCPKCEKPLNFAKNMKQWEEGYAGEVQGGAAINIFCMECEEGGYMVFLESYTEVEMVDSPGLDKKVAMPKI